MSTGFAMHPASTRAISTRFLRRHRRAAGLFSLVAVALLGAGVASFRRDLPLDQLRLKYATGASKFVRIDGMEVHYRDEGAGPALILVHGSNCSLHVWEGWHQRLRKQCRVISVDLPGHGLTGPDPNGNYDTPSMVRFLDHLAEALRIDRFSMAGNSMGGAIALHYALSHPTKVERLILIDSIGYPDERPPWMLRMWGYPVLGRMLTVLTPRFAYAQTIKEIYGHKERVNEPLIDRYYELLLRDGNRDATRIRFTHPVWEVDGSRMKGIRVPTLVMWGGRDPWFSPEFGTRFARDLPNAQLRIYAGLGHVPMEEAPEVTARDAAAFLAGGRLRPL